MPDTPAGAFARFDDSPDELFYRAPRFVTHIDDNAIAAVTRLYRERFPPGGAILDLMTSWVSHLPPEVPYRRVAGVGINAEELACNPRLDEYLVRNLNTDPSLPFEDGAFGGAGICVSIQYLTQPVALLRGAGRVLRPGAPLVITYSNRCFPSKAVAIWRALDCESHGRLVERYLRDAGAWRDIERLDRSPRGGDPLYAVVGRSAGAPPREAQ